MALSQLARGKEGFRLTAGIAGGCKGREGDTHRIYSSALHETFSDWVSTAEVY